MRLPGKYFNKSNSVRNLFLSCALSVVPILRLLSVNRHFFTETLWAEDGLFTLCFRKTGVFTCLSKGFSGYLEGLPRFTGLVASMFDPKYWALLINLQAIVIYILISLFLLNYLQSKDIPRTSKFLLVAPPTLLAFSGSEIIGVIANDYLIFFYACLVYLTIAIWDQHTFTHKNSAALIFIILALSSPLGVLAEMFLIAALLYTKKTMTAKSFLLLVTSANIFQITVMVSELGNRHQSFYFPYFMRELVQSLLKSIFYLIYTPSSGDFIPGVHLNNGMYFAVFSLAAISLFTFRKSIFLISKNKLQILLGAQVLAAFVFLLISILSNGSPSRYLNLLIMINVLIFVTISLKNDKREIFKINIVAIGFLALNLLINFQVSTARVSAPSWPEEWSRAKAACALDFQTYDVTFSPLWPTVNKHTYPLIEPLTNIINCDSVF